MDPLSGRLLTYAWNAGEVVTGVAAQRSEVWVLPRRQPILLLNRRRIHSRQIGNSFSGVEDGRVVIDQLECVPITGEDVDIKALFPGLSRKSRDDVVRLVAFPRQSRDAHRSEDLS